MKLRKIVLVSLLVIMTDLAFSHKTELLFLSGRDAGNTVKWEFFCTDGRNSGKWTHIPVPSNWELQGFGTYNYGHDWRNENKKLRKEHGLYRYKIRNTARLERQNREH